MTDHKAEPMRGRIIEVDFGKGTVTFRMEPPYYVTSGEFLIAPIGGGISLDAPTAAPAASEATINSDGIDSKLIDAASEGEDGAVAHGYINGYLPRQRAVEIRLDDGVPKWITDSAVFRVTIAPEATRPAAQVAATPKHDEGREAESVERLRTWAQGLILQLPCTHEGRNSWLLNYGVGEESDWLRAEHARYSKEWANWRAGEPTPEMRRYPDPALATQPAARRVTDGIWVEPVIVPGSPHAHIVRFRCGQQRFDIGDALDTMEEAKAFAAMFRHALESFAQPAEGVSGKKHDGPCWRNNHADCGC